MACLNCRTPKVRCIPSEQPPKNPCARCVKLALKCVYVGNTSAIGESDQGLAAEPPPMSWKTPLNGPDFEWGRNPTPQTDAPAVSPPFSGSWSASPSASSQTEPEFGSTRPAHNPHPQAHWTPGHYSSADDPPFLTPSPSGSNLTSTNSGYHHPPGYGQSSSATRQPAPIFTLHREYELQTAHAREYLTARQRPTHPPPTWPAGQQDASADHALDPLYVNTEMQYFGQSFSNYNYAWSPDEGST
ncbi:hypothetical protein B0H17DRAFT_1137320 [Mycena rosella]|uniref:Zn(2)-C6 fungal-type domain-containing protein n=1 Tax=Mycena rosella TaxID=1033263 RepID=A0AAD7D8X4_MYCRO|nr:hypothetical protein B0H17DRAFT_1137320 [Mycena rosella]